MSKKYHFTGVGGVGMAAVAFLLRKSGQDVTGCDLYQTPRTAWLEQNGVAVAVGHSPSHIHPNLDVCVFTPAVPKESPEFLAAQRSGCTIKYRGEVLAEILNKTDGIAVCGTHGKTTTSAFITKLLIALGEKPSWCIGGETGNLPVAGTGPGPLVAEADESDGTLALYKAKTLVVTSLDYDHPDHFKTYEDYLECYRKAISSADEVIESSKLPCDDWPEIRSLVLGEHNVRNARTAVEVALRRGHSRESILSALPHAVDRLPDRRFERIWPHKDSVNQDATVISDYAHHPAEIECALSMARSLKPKRLRVIFQPHRYSRTKAFAGEFARVLSIADETVLVPVYPAFEKPILGGDIADLYCKMRELSAKDSSSRTILARSALEAWRHAYLTMEQGDAIILLGAGDIIKICSRVLEDMRRKPISSPSGVVNLADHSFFRTGGVSFGCIRHTMPEAPRDAIIAGAGSNTWFSDCATDADIVKAPPESNAAKTGASLISSRLDLSFMAGIPGTVGGWAKMNAGAFGDSFGNYIDHVIADGRKIPASDCAFGYRSSNISGLITHVELKPAASKQPQTANEHLSRRRKFPPRTCGSVFKNPSPETPAGKLLEEAGCKSLSVGGAYVWSEHANVIVAGEGCTSSDILALARIMAARVKEYSGISLEPEIRGLEI